MRIAGITLSDKKRLEIALTAVYGVGRPKALEILKQAKVNPGKKPNDVTEEEEKAIRVLVEKLDIEGSLRRKVGANIKRLKDTGAYRGTRHAKNLPTRGQRTKTNSRTNRGNVRKTMGSGRRSVEKK